MRGITFAMGVGVVASLAACEDPQVSIVLDFPEEVLTGDEKPLAEELVQLQASVYEFARTCDDLSFGRVSVEVQDESLRSREVSTKRAGGEFGAVHLGGIPRLGPKVIAVRGFDATGGMMAGGCVDLGDIDDDVTASIELHRSLVLRVLPSELVAPSLIFPAPADATLSILAAQRRLTAPVELAALRASVRAEPTDVEVPYGEIVPPAIDGAAADVFTLEGLTTPEVDEQPVIGPVELVVRGRWADQVSTVSAMMLPEPIAQVLLSEIDGPNRTAPSWAVVEAGAFVYAVARYEGNAGEPKLVLIREEGGALRRVAVVDAPGALALGVVEDASGARTIATRTAIGWAWLEISMGMPVVHRGPVEQTTAAEQLLGVPACVGERVGVLGVVGSDVIGWSAIDGSPPAGADADIGSLAAAIDGLAVDGATVELLDAWCLAVSRTDGVDRERPVVAVRRTALGRQVTYLVTPDIPPLATPFVGGISVTAQSRPSLLAVTVGPSGPRIGTFRLRYTDTFAPAVVPDFVIDHPLPSAAIAVTSMIVQRGDDEPVLIDTLGLHALGGAVGLSATRASDPPGHELSAMAVADLMGTNQRFIRVDFGDTTARREVLIAGDNGLVVYDLTRVEPPQ